MKLFLASQGSESIQQIDKFVGGLSRKRVAYIVSAANGEGYGSWRRSDSIRILQPLVKDFQIVELENYRFSNINNQLAEADLIWVGGGQTGYLLYWLRRLELDKLFSSFGDEKIYVGSSAGSMACSKTQYMSEIYPGEEELGAAAIPGLGLIDFEILPHFEDKNLDLVKKIWTHDVPLYLLKNGEAITVVDGKVSVLGEERIIKNV